MSVLAYPPPLNEEEIFRQCNKECGVICATEDQQFFSLRCIFCAEKFLYFDAFITHMQTVHAVQGQHDGSGFHGIFGNADDMDGMGCTNGQGPNGMRLGGGGCVDGMLDDDDLADTSLLEPQMVMIKEEIMDEDAKNEDSFISGLPSANEIADVANALFQVKQEQPEPEVSMQIGNETYMSDAYNSYGDYPNVGGGGGDTNGNEEDNCDDEDETRDDTNYDDLVEESLLGAAGMTMHIKDRKMIQFLIDAYRRNPFLWDHRHPQFRDRVKRQHFLEWIIIEFKRRFNLNLAKDAVTRKWDNLRTVYKRECNRMSQEKTNVSTLWYFKELHFLNRLYGGNQKLSEAVVKETVYRRRYSALWNDVSTSKLLHMVERYPCFYDKYNVDYRSKEKRGEALQMMALELQQMIDVTTIQISKRISQLRFDYSKQKQERLLCEQANRSFAPSYTYYDQMQFMDADVAPFKCDACPMVLQTPRELDVHVLTHQTNSGHSCAICHIHFHDAEELNRHKQVHATALTVTKKYQCDLCTASFRERANYDEHMRRHNDELLLPSLAAPPSDMAVAAAVVAAAASNVDMKPYVCDICGKAFAHSSYLNAHRALHTGDRHFKCDYPQCGRTFTTRQSMLEHGKLHYSEEEFRCEICGKGFKSSKNLQNHKQIHDAVKRYVCKICGSAFAQAAGLYLHKRRHNRQVVHPQRHSY